MPVLFGLVIASSNGDYTLVGGEQRYAKLDRRDPITLAFSTVLSVDTGVASFPILQHFTASPINTYQATIYEPHGLGSARTDDGISWVTNGQAAQSRDPSNGDCFIGGNQIAKSTDNGLTYPTVLVTMADVTPPGNIQGVTITSSVAVLDDVVWFQVLDLDLTETDPDYSQLWRVNTDGTGLAKLTWPGTLPDEINIYSSWFTNRVWVWEAKSTTINGTYTDIWKIDTTTGAVTNATLPTLVGADRIGMLLSTSNSRVLAHVIDNVEGIVAHSGVAVVYESTDDGVTWATTLFSQGITGIAGCIDREFIGIGGTLWQNPSVPTHLAMVHKVPLYFESIDSGVTWIQRSFTPNLPFPHFSAIGFAALSDASLRRAGRTSTVVGAT